MWHSSAVQAKGEIILLQLREIKLLQLLNIGNAKFVQEKKKMKL